MSTEYGRYITAVQSFRDKYFTIPGDMANATQFWTRLAATADCVTNSSAAVGTPGSCDGDGDGLIAWAAAASQSSESFQFWRQLALAGLIEGSYSGMSGSGGQYHSVAGTNVPKSRISNGAWYIQNFATRTGASDIFDGTYNNSFELGAPNSSQDPNGVLLKPEELWNIDTKLDDGLPAQGKVVVRNYTTCTPATLSSQTTTTYALNSSSLGCIAMFRQAF